MAKNFIIVVWTSYWWHPMTQYPWRELYFYHSNYINTICDNMDWSRLILNKLTDLILFYVWCSFHFEFMSIQLVMTNDLNNYDGDSIKFQLRQMKYQIQNNDIKCARLFQTSVAPTSEQFLLEWNVKHRSFQTIQRSGLITNPRWIWILVMYDKQQIWLYLYGAVILKINYVLHAVLTLRLHFIVQKRETIS